MTYRLPTEKLKAIKLVLLDVDGVLTDGRIIYTDGGEEIKVFHVRDGMGIRLLMTAEIGVGIVTGRRSDALLHRCKNIGIDMVFDGVRDKAAVFDTILKQTGLSAENVAFVGDDLPDLPIMKRAGLSAAVADAHPIVLEQADMITNSKGGEGAVREVCEAILTAQGFWEKIMERF
jgi:3-deoxy-D-manno-octulosonate 8-phosphate phosphatase (KDO 8-P phosphatase)